MSLLGKILISFVFISNAYAKVNCSNISRFISRAKVMYVKTDNLSKKLSKSTGKAPASTTRKTNLATDLLYLSVKKEKYKMLYKHYRSYQKNNCKK